MPENTERGDWLHADLLLKWYAHMNMWRANGAASMKSFTASSDHWCNCWLPISACKYEFQGPNSPPEYQCEFMPLTPTRIHEANTRWWIRIPGWEFSLRKPVRVRRVPNQLYCRLRSWKRWFYADLLLGCLSHKFMCFSCANRAESIELCFIK
jgi:hypothetical protein